MQASPPRLAHGWTLSRGSGSQPARGIATDIGQYRKLNEHYLWAARTSSEMPNGWFVRNDIGGKGIYQQLCDRCERSASQGRARNVDA
jgi:hypothetical protein